MHIDAQLFTVLLFAHLLSDYVLQTSQITAMKSKSIKGVAVHELIVIVSTAAPEHLWVGRAAAFNWYSCFTLHN
jgi:hypothetical protein